MAAWIRKLQIKLKQNLDMFINYTNQTSEQQSIFLNYLIILFANTSKDLGMTLDAKLRRNAHVKKRQEELQIKFW